MARPTACQGIVTALAPPMKIARVFVSSSVPLGCAGSSGTLTGALK
jgi:hypothetical protein